MVRLLFSASASKPSKKELSSTALFEFEYRKIMEQIIGSRSSRSLAPFRRDNYHITKNVATTYYSAPNSAGAGAG
ncbi:hypothetical protein EVAR_28116_1 [Eumeta japonica]|uniref:Uncharacterized protein n=1 Tax=Eumeta variegata TaxID=151549 RepID=A0A4C1VGD6_EUMVA|nr:hypothetical protein EVAR_28116_1 [Eumeta japonica]